MGATATSTAVRERPILFSGPMVRAILDGSKTQTRRVVTQRTALEWLAPGMFTPAFVADPDNGLCPYGKPGDRLWVRETWQLLQFDHDWETGCVDGWEPWEGKVPASRPLGYVTAFDTDDGWGSDREERGFGWRPSIFMPRWASRITLEITDVRVERVQAISESDARAEGAEQASDPDDITADDGALNVECGYFPPRSYVDGYRLLWDSLNASRGYGWEANPWVWVLTFRPLAPA